jgi:hypothetical protein
MSDANTRGPVETLVPTTIERRAWVRYASSLKTLCQSNAARIEDFWQLARIQNISVSGVSLVLNRPFEVESSIIVDPIHIRSLAMPSITARVVHATAQPDGSWVVGCAFATPLSLEQLESLLDEGSV